MPTIFFKVHCMLLNVHVCTVQFVNSLEYFKHHCFLQEHKDLDSIYWGQMFKALYNNRACTYNVPFRRTTFRENGPAWEWCKNNCWARLCTHSLQIWLYSKVSSDVQQHWPTVIIIILYTRTHKNFNSADVVTMATNGRWYATKSLHYGTCCRGAALKGRYRVNKDGRQTKHG
jgi:hypothetical protein